jgi:hypothetical protein
LAVVEQIGDSPPGVTWSPTIRTGGLAETPWFDVFCPGSSQAMDLRTVNRRPRSTGALPVDASGSERYAQIGTAAPVVLF